MSFRVANTSQNTLSNKLNYETLPRLQSHLALQVGDYKLTARSADINGWLVCNGRSLSRTEYASLFSVIGVDFGSADSTHFNIPDYTSKVIGMYGTPAGEPGLTIRDRGDVVGHETIKLTVPQLPAHSHTGTTNSSGSHSHNVNNIPYGTQTSLGPALSNVNSCDETVHTVSTEAAGAHTHTFTSNNTGENADIDVMQPTLFGSSVMIFAKFLNRLQLTPTTWG